MGIWDERYREEGFAYGKKPNEFLVEFARVFPKGGKILSLGEGEGRNAIYLAARGHFVTALDRSAVGLLKAQERARQEGLSVATVTADLADYDLGREAWDGILSIWCHLPPTLRRTVHAKVVEALKPGGILLLEAYGPRQLEFHTGGPQSPDHLADLAALRMELKGLEWIHAEEIEREVQEGKHHNGPSAVVQLIGKKPG